MKRRGKVDTDDKILNPLFPRMHVNDRDKGGGPKPPPRNKMALYEQPPAAAAAATATSHRIICTAPPAFPFPPPKYSAVATSASSSNYDYVSSQPVSNGGQERRNGFAMQINSPATAPQFYAHNNAVAMMNAPTPLLLPFPMFDGQVSSSPNDCRISLDKKPQGVASSRYVDDKRQNEKLRAEFKMFQQIHFRNETDGNKQQGRVAEPIEALSQSSAATNVLLPSSKTMSSMEWQLSNQQCSRKTQQCLKSQSEALGSGSSTKPTNNVEQVGASDLIGSETPATDDVRGAHEDCERRLPVSQNVCKKKDDCRWEISATETSSNVHMRREDVIAINGEETFLKLRNEMIKHQKLFVEQVFELHRLMAVQRLMAQTTRTSLGEDRHKLEKPSSSRTSNPKELQKEHNLERQDDSTMPKTSSGCPKEMIYLPPKSKDLFKVPSFTPRATQETLARNPKPANAGTPWIYPHPGTANHWLVPVLSPSEGLIYKPYPIPASAPSPAGFMPPPIYGSCEPIHTIPPPKPHPASQQSGIRPFADIPPYFPHSSSHTVTTSTSAFGQAGMAGSYRHPNIALADGSLKSSWNFSSLVSATVSGNIDAIRQAKDGGAHQDSTASSSPPGRAEGKVLPLFPVEPTGIAMQNKLQHQKQAQCQSSEQQSKVIKALPRQPKSTSGSATRILMSIQDDEK
uniref:Early flowering 3 n=1 Tax=Kalanchoe fedtschenkoi TaxID=63787 RepID=A0A7N0UXN9_KALFE